MIKLRLNDYYSTSDLCLSALLSLYFPLDCINKINPHKAQFLFKRTPELEKVIESYWKGQLKIEPRTYFNQIKYLKSRLYE